MAAEFTDEEEEFLAVVSGAIEANQGAIPGNIDEIIDQATDRIQRQLADAARERMDTALDGAIDFHENRTASGKGPKPGFGLFNAELLASMSARDSGDTATLRSFASWLKRKLMQWQAETHLHE